MKIGIITQHRVFNYGSVLQAYATQIAIERLGYKAEIIDYFSEQRTYFRQFCELPEGWRMLSPKGVAHILTRLPGNIKKKCVFDHFLKKNVRLTRRKYISHQDLQTFPPDADVYMTGSDQVWNSDYNQGVDPSYFLDFGDEAVRRVSYAASVGMEAIPDHEAEMVKRLLSSYDVITVREISAREALQAIGVNNVKVVLDPTLLLCKVDWEKIERRIKRKGYILVVILYGEECGIPEIARKISKETGLPIVELVWNPLKKRPWKTIYGCSPEEFLGYIHNAQLIITNSFHVTSFAVIYRKKFISVKREMYNSRIESLLSQLGIRERYISPDETEEIMYQPIPYERVEEKLLALQKDSYDILRTMIKE